MKNDFDKQIKDMLEGSMPVDTGFELDRKAVWSKIESKQKTKVIPFKKWASHAAAVVIGILLCLPFLFHQKETVKTVTVTKTIPSIQKINDTVFLVQNTTTQHNQPIVTKRNSSPQSIVSTPLQLKKEDNNTHDIMPIKGSEQIIAKAETIRPQVKVLHLVDMENENAFPQVRHTENYSLFNKITIPAHMDDKSETVSMIVANQIFNSKN